MSPPADPREPTIFRAKRWIYFAQAGMFSPLAAFSLILGPLSLSGIFRRVNGQPATDAGWPLIVVGTFLFLVFALAVVQIGHRRAPTLRLCREGIEFRLIGRTTLDAVPLVPRLIRVAWSIASTQGFRARTVRLPWSTFGEAQIAGGPMAHVLFLSARAEPDEDRLAGPAPPERYALHQVEFVDPVDRIAATISRVAGAPGTWRHLPSWDHDPNALGLSTRIDPLA